MRNVPSRFAAVVDMRESQHKHKSMYNTVVDTGGRGMYSKSNVHFRQLVLKSMVWAN